ncbi:MAG TPA: DUF2398 family protein [Kofleriaceae bacterium]|nr:DUF2398 family protein [Kofleriaceae bacterium]
MTYFDKIHQGRARQILNVLTEAPFFYPDDDPDLFLFLRRNRAEFARFFADTFGWDLVVEARCARLYKPRWYNKAIRPSQHDVFELSRQGDCVAFLLVLEHYERLLDQTGASVDDPEPPRFYFGELLEFAVGRFAEELSGAAPGEAEVRKMLRGLMPALLRFRFLREVEPPRDAAGLDPENLIYECLPALHHYDVRRLTPRALASFFGQDEPGDDEGEGERAPELEPGRAADAGADGEEVTA